MQITKNVNGANLQIPKEFIQDCKIFSLDLGKLQTKVNRVFDKWLKKTNPDTKGPYTENTIAKWIRHEMKDQYSAHTIIKVLRNQHPNVIQVQVHKGKRLKKVQPFTPLALPNNVVSAIPVSKQPLSNPIVATESKMDDATKTQILEKIAEEDNRREETFGIFQNPKFDPRNYKAKDLWGLSHTQLETIIYDLAGINRNLVDELKRLDKKNSTLLKENTKLQDKVTKLEKSGTNTK